MTPPRERIPNCSACGSRHYPWKAHNTWDEPPEPDESMPDQKLPILGRDRVLIDLLTKMVRDRIYQHKIAPTRSRERGNSFEVQIVGDDGEPTGHIARITVELERVEP